MLKGLRILVVTTILKMLREFFEIDLKKGMRLCASRLLIVSGGKVEAISRPNTSMNKNSEIKHENNTANRSRVGVNKLE